MLVQVGDDDDDELKISIN